jgi:regulator of sigma E protease
MTIILFLAILFLLVLVHEFGHFIVAKKFGVRVDEFGVGFPPKLFGIKKGETEYTFNMLPIGGFVKIFGENPDTESLTGPEKERSMVHKPRWKQAAILTAGVAFNIIFAWMLFVVGFTVGLPTSISEDDLSRVTDPKLFVGAVLPDSPAEKTGLQQGDSIYEIVSEREMLTGDPLLPDAVSGFIGSVGTEEILLRIRRGDEDIELTVSPEQGILETEPERFAIGISMEIAGIMKLPVHEAIVEGTTVTYTMLVTVTKNISYFIKDALLFRADLSAVAGPVGIAGLVGEASALGFTYLLTFTAFISLHLAVINMIPFPALDGGRLLIVLIEGVVRRRIAPAVVNTMNTAGFILLLALMALVTYNDIVRLAG